MKVNVQEATVRTCQVTIKSLTVSNKQVTMALFRQLENEDILDDGFDLKGVPWGRINYWPGDCCPGKGMYKGLHLVWQLGDELRRCCVRKWERPVKVEATLDGIGEAANERNQEAQDFILAAARYYDVSDERIRGAESWSAVSRIYEIGHEYVRPMGWIERRISKICEEIGKSAPATKEQERVDAWNELVDNWEKRVKEFESLNQLFIAV